MNNSACKKTLMMILVTGLIPVAAPGGEVSTAGVVEVLEGPPPGYEVVRLTPPEEFGIHSAPDINDNGDIIWSFSVVPVTSKIHMFREGRFYTMTDGATYDVNPGLNNNGEYIYLTAPSASQDQDIRVIMGGQEFLLDAFEAGSAPVINDDGFAVYSDDFSGNFSHVALFLFDGRKPPVQITSDEFSNQSARWNQHGDLVWSAKDTEPPWTASIMFRRADGTTQQLTGFENHRANPDINDCGQIVWYEGDVGIMHWSNGAISTLTSNNERVPKINDFGELTFARWNQRIQIYDTFVRKGVIEYNLGDGLHSAARSAINNHGEVAFRGINDIDGSTDLFLMRRIAPKGDTNGDCDVDFHDFAMMQHCFTGADSGPLDGFLADCTRADFDDDGDVDLEDLSLFELAFTGADQTVADCIP